MEEEWRIIEIAPNFLISDQGRVQNRTTGRFPKISYLGQYPIVNLHCDRRWFSKAVHILVASAFVDGQAPGLEVNHKDRDKTNFLPYNLEWVTHKENMEHCRVRSWDENGTLIEEPRKYRNYKEEWEQFEKEQ